METSGCNRRRAAEFDGRQAEERVASQCRSQGFSVLARRLRTKSGEIDLVVADRATLVFIEVKSRKSLAEAAYSIPPRQQARLLDAASAALALHEDWQRPNTRFDVALVCQGAIEHIEDAIRYN
jgi:putative endonuclease